MEVLFKMKIKIITVLFIISLFINQCCLAENNFFSDNLNNAEELPYKIETLSNINLQHSYYYQYYWLTLANDKIYYIDTNDDDINVVNSLDTITLEKNEILKTGETLNYNGKIYTINDIEHIFYDNNNDRIVALTKAEYTSILNPASKRFLVDLLKHEIICICPYDKFFSPRDNVPYYVDNDDYMWLNTYQDNECRYRYNFKGSKKQAMFTSNVYGCMDATLLDEKNDFLYVFTSDGIKKFDYQEINTVLSGNHNYGWNKNGIIINSDDGFLKIDYNLNEKYEIKKSEISIKDKKRFSMNYIAYKMYLNSHNEIIFYDENNSALRKLSRVIKNTSEETVDGYRFTTNHEKDFDDIAYLGGTVVAALYDKSTDVLKEIRFENFYGKPIDFNFHNDKKKTYVKIFWIDKNTLSPKTNMMTIGK